jgi:lambda repressor-like predicted transcriptional regulator
VAENVTTYTISHSPTNTEGRIDMTQSAKLLMHLDAIRVEQGLTKAEVAGRMGLTPAALTQKYGRKWLSLESIVSMAEAMGLRVTVTVERD